MNPEQRVQPFRFFLERQQAKHSSKLHRKALQRDPLLFSKLVASKNGKRKRIIRFTTFCLCSTEKLCGGPLVLSETRIFSFISFYTKILKSPIFGMFFRRPSSLYWEEPNFVKHQRGRPTLFFATARQKKSQKSLMPPCRTLKIFQNVSSKKISDNLFTRTELFENTSIENFTIPPLHTRTHTHNFTKIRFYFSNTRIARIFVTPSHIKNF